MDKVPNPEAKKEHLRSMVSLQDGRTEGEQFIGVLTSDTGDFGVFLDSEGKVIDGTDQWGSSKNNSDRAVVRDRAVEIYKEAFPDGDVSEVERWLSDSDDDEPAKS